MRITGNVRVAHMLNQLLDFLAGWCRQEADDDDQRKAQWHTEDTG